MRRWTILVTVLGFVMACGTGGYAQTPSGSGDNMGKDKMMEMEKKDDKMMGKDKMMDKTQHDKMMKKDKMMEKKDDNDKMMEKKQ